MVGKEKNPLKLTTRKPKKLFMVFHVDPDVIILIKATSKEEIIFKLREEPISTHEEETWWESEEIRDNFIRTMEIKEATLELLMKHVDDDMGSSLIAGWDM